MKNCTFVRFISRKPSSSTRYFWCEEKQIYFNVLWPSCGTNNIKNYGNLLFYVTQYLFRECTFLNTFYCVFEDQHPTFWDCHSSHLHVQFQVSEVRDFEPISSLQSKYSSHAMHSTAYTGFSVDFWAGGSNLWTGGWWRRLKGGARGP